MPEHRTFVEFLRSSSVVPLMCVKGYEIHEITFSGVTTYPIIYSEDDKLVASENSLNEAVVFIVDELIRGIAIKYLGYGVLHKERFGE